MKFKLDVEYSTEEYKTLLNLVKHVFDRCMDQDKEIEIELAKENKKLRVKSDKKKDVFDEDDCIDDSEESSYEDSSEEDLYTVPHEEVSDKDIMVVEGKEVFDNLIRGWLENFLTEGEQPDRVEMLRALSVSRNGFRILAYLQDQKCLTIPIAKFLEENTISHPLDDSISTEVYARTIAEHLAQCSSIIFYQISDFLRYPNPLEK